MTDYTIFYKEDLCVDQLGHLEEYDLFLSAFDNCSRTTNIYSKIPAKEKKWFIFPQYNFPKEDFPSGNIYVNDIYEESDYYKDFINNFADEKTKICIDITGFIRPHLIYLLRFLSLKIRTIDLLYTEPILYKDSDDTKFSGFVDSVRDIQGCSSVNSQPNTDNDILIICAGYDANLITRVTQQKNHCAKKYYIIGFPSLQPDMYQECVLKIERAKESIGESREIRYAPAFDPFVTAQIIDDIIKENNNVGNIYLSPLSTKPQTIGMAFYYILNYNEKPISMVFPFSKTYNSHHAEGCKRTWKYTLEF